MAHKTVVIFGTFDGVHDGHRAFIREAKEYGDRLIVVVARDMAVQTLKGKLPLKNEISRVNSLLDIEDVNLVLLGDCDLGDYHILKDIKPEVVCLGYDQDALFDDIKKNIESGVLPQMNLIHAEAYKPEIFHSSLLNKR